MDSEIHDIHTANYKALPKELRKELYDFLHREFPPVFFEGIRLGHMIYGKDWWRQDEPSFNMKEGLACRTAFRKAGYLDYDLPCGNWDAVYIPVLEAATDLRPIIFPDELKKQDSN